MRREATGHYEITSTSGEAVRAFVPAPLPPKPPVVLAGSLQALHERALLACGRLDGVSSLLPDPELFLYAGQPLLYLSLFLKQHRSRYYELLDGVRQNGDWEAWIDFFSRGGREHGIGRRGDGPAVAGAVPRR